MISVNKKLEYYGNENKVIVYDFYRQMYICFFREKDDGFTLNVSFYKNIDAGSVHFSKLDDCIQYATIMGFLDSLQVSDLQKIVAMLRGKTSSHPWECLKER